MADILVVEDDAASRLLVATVVTQLGHNAHCCKDGLEAYVALCAAPDAQAMIITDIAMPCMDGITLCSRLRDERGLSLPILAVTSYHRSLFNPELVALFSAWLLKPLDVEDLRRHIQALLGSDSPSPAAGQRRS